MHFTSFSTSDLDLKLILRKQVPDFHSPAPRKKSSSAIGSLGAASSGYHWNSAKGGLELAGKVVGDDEGLTLGRFEGLEAAGGAPARGPSGTR
jgi:hypothetical protein